MDKDKINFIFGSVKFVFVVSVIIVSFFGIHDRMEEQAKLPHDALGQVITSDTVMVCIGTQVTHGVEFYVDQNTGLIWFRSNIFGEAGKVRFSLYYNAQGVPMTIDEWLSNYTIEGDYEHEKNY